ncbi:hypothetical protein BH11PLA1_BH11PLA1_07800 [soil metagenome]
MAHVAAYSRSSSAFLLAAAGALGAAGSAHAQSYHCTVNAVTSASSGSVGATLNVNGGLIGDYAPANLTGTRTLLGLFGGGSTTNQNIPLTGTGGTPNPAPTFAAKPAGTFDLKILGNTVYLSGLSVDLLGASPDPSIPISLSVTYQTFRTAAPAYFYPNLGAIAVPVGNAIVNALDLASTAPASGMLTVVNPTRRSFSVSLPATLTTTIDLQGTVSSNTAPSTITVSGTIDAPDGRPPTITASLTTPLAVTQPLPPTPGTPQPFDLPPPTGTGMPAHVLLTINLVAPSSASVNGSATLPAAGALLSPADIADDAGNAPPLAGASNSGVNEGDYNAFFNGFFNASTWCDIADDAGIPLPGGPGNSNNGVNEGDYNCFFNFFFT